MCQCAKSNVACDAYITLQRNSSRERRVYYKTVPPSLQANAINVRVVASTARIAYERRIFRQSQEVYFTLESLQISYCYAATLHCTAYQYKPRVPSSRTGPWTLKRDLNCARSNYCGPRLFPRKETPRIAQVVASGREFDAIRCRSPRYTSGPHSPIRLPVGAIAFVRGSIRFRLGCCQPVSAC
jgi:hypothetical protein